MCVCEVMKNVMVLFMYSSITSDSGVELCTHEAPSTVEQQIDSCLIQLQTYSLGMTNILSKRAEYNVL